MTDDPRQDPRDGGEAHRSAGEAVGETLADTLAGARAALEAGQEAAARPVGATVSAARGAIGRAGRVLGRDRAARTRRLRRQARSPLPLLFDLHPEARRALPHPLGVRTIALADVAGSAVEPPQRGGDFLPLPALRTKNWEGRWQRLRWANERLAQLPPIDVVHFADRYWVTDGHNRVALALYEDQPEIDANVIDLHLPGHARERAGALAPLLEEARQAGPRTLVPPAPAADDPSDEEADG